MSRIDFSDPASWASVTLRTRMPEILTHAIDYLHKRIRAVATTPKPASSSSTPTALLQQSLGPSDGSVLFSDEELGQARNAIGKLTQLKYELQTNKAIRPIADDGDDLAYWNSLIRKCVAAWRLCLVARVIITSMGAASFLCFG